MPQSHPKAFSLNSVAEQKQTLRANLRSKRKALTSTEQTAAAANFSIIMEAFLATHRPKHIALYLANDGELDLSVFMQRCQQWQAQICLPVLHSDKPKMWFAQYAVGDELIENRFGIPEPRHAPEIPPWMLDYVLFPLVGFDEQGGRLGMGGGFYDRTFAHASRWQKQPKLIGVAHECQKVDALPLESWDIKLDAVVSDRAVYQN